jgi:hypothetical protein
MRIIGLRLWYDGDSNILGVLVTSARATSPSRLTTSRAAYVHPGDD